MEEVLLYLYEKYPGPILGFITNSTTKQQNRSLIKVIQNHLFDNMTSQELAFLCNMSISTSRRKFLDIYQMFFEPSEDNSVIVDFNLAINPPCTYSSFTTCAFAPRENWLPFKVLAGEKYE